MATLACPSNSRTILGWTFFWNRSEAQVCRRSWNDASDRGGLGAYAGVGFAGAAEGLAVAGAGLGSGVGSGRATYPPPTPLHRSF